jgi:subtilisin family serine protease
MKRLLAASLLLSAAACAPAPESNEPQNGDVIPGRWIVTLDGSALPAGFAAGDAQSVSLAADKLATVAVFQRDLVYSNALQGFSMEASLEEAERLARDPRVRSIEPDRVVILAHDVEAEGKPAPSQPSQATPWGITRVGGAGDGTGKTAWVIDSGIQLNHPDLNVDVARSRTFLGGNTTPDDQNGHGTHVAGTIAAKNDGVGVVGVAAGAQVVAVRVLDRRGSGSYSGVIAGVDYVAANGAAGDVANMSLGGPVSAALDAAVLSASANVKFALAAGNESDNANNHSPARVNGANIYTISATDINDAFASFSNYGAPVDFAEPGVSIRSTYKGGSYATLSGTSMASPHAAGLLLLGNIANGGTASGDPDGNPDVIGVR